MITAQASTGELNGPMSGLFLSELKIGTGGHGDTKKAYPVDRNETYVLVDHKIADMRVRSPLLADAVNALRSKGKYGKIRSYRIEKGHNCTPIGYKYEFKKVVSRDGNGEPLKFSDILVVWKRGKYTVYEDGILRRRM